MDKKIKEITPPKSADRFFEWYCNADMQEEILGDLYESFMDKSANGNLFQAKCWYWLQIILFINRRTLSRDNNLFTQLNSVDMFRNYFKIGYRNILKNKGTTFINAFGMALAIGCCLVVFRFVDYMYKMDDFHSKRDEIYVVQRTIEQNGLNSTWNDIPQPLGKALINDFPQLESMVRLNRHSGVLQYDDKVFSEWVSFVDDDYYELFDFPIKWGNKANFSNPEAIVLNIHIAEKYFGSKNPIGESLDIRFNHKGTEITERFVIQGVLDKNPRNASFSDQILIPFQRQKILRDKMEDWTIMSSATFIHAKSPSVIAEIKGAESRYLALIDKAHDGWNMVGLNFQPFKSITLNGSKLHNNIFNWTEKLSIVSLISIAIILLLLVCFNYINITLAAAASRLKEISVRKVMGSNRQQIILQFLSENLLICGCSMMIGILLAYSIFLPWFNNMFNGMGLELSFVKNPSIWFFTLGLVLITAIGGAGYPALYISKFPPTAILKKEFNLGSKNGFRKALISAQLVLTVITIFVTFVFLLNTRKLKEKDWGYQQHGLTVIQIEEGADYEALKTALQSHPNVLSIAGSKEQLGINPSAIEIESAGESYNVLSMQIDNDYLPTIGITLVDGRNFDKKLETDQQQSIIVNETFRRLMNWQQAAGQNLKIGTKNYYVVGEVKDFHLENFYHDIKPIIFQMTPPESIKYVSVRCLPGTTASTAKALESNWKKIYPHTPYNYAFQDNVFFIYFTILRQANSLFQATAFLTILIAIIGFFGLAMLLLNRKMKELSIRKVLGANFFHISYLINKEFFLPLLFALLLGLPLAASLSETLLHKIAPDSPIGIWPFVLTIGSICLMLVISLSKHIYTAAVSNPSHFLKDE